MAIKNGLTPRFAEVGKIKIGGHGETRKDKAGKDYQLPVRYEHFVVTTTEKKDGNFMIDKDLMSKLGNTPKEIPFRLMFDSIDMNFYTSFQYYHGNKCVCKGDGKTAIRINEKAEEKNIKCEPSECKYLQPDEKGVTKCKPCGILSCHIPDAMIAGGVYRFRTHSWNSISAILASLEYISENTRGVLRGIPLKLVFLKKATQDHGNVNIVTVVLDGVEMLKASQLAFTEFEERTKIGLDIKNIETRARQAGFLNDPDDPADVETEFYNEHEILEADTVKPGITADQAVDKMKDAKQETPRTSEGQGSLL